VCRGVTSVTRRGPLWIGRSLAERRAKGRCARAGNASSVLRPWKTERLGCGCFCGSPFPPPAAAARAYGSRSTSHLGLLRPGARARGPAAPSDNRRGSATPRDAGVVKRFLVSLPSPLLPGLGRAASTHSVRRRVETFEAKPTLEDPIEPHELAVAPRSSWPARGHKQTRR
jgi:hypothetical protein